MSGLSPRRLGFDPRSVHVKIVVDKVEAEHVLFRVPLYSPAHITAPVLHTHLHVDAALSRREKKRGQSNFQKAILFSEIEEHWRRKILSQIFLPFEELIQPRAVITIGEAFKAHF